VILVGGSDEVTHLSVPPWQGAGLSAGAPFARIGALQGKEISSAVVTTAL
jgi:hypothetical protein